ncbi:hypothetical protein ACUNWD_01260 [Sunxiuqinia sp. A32]|uniref:hypothetical protein n=1 Tax=Sunxiuqinia sp. A32 TaxID=3461496 RepID=UPI0040459684
MKLYTTEQLHEPFTKEQFEAKWKEYLTKLDERPALKATLSNIPEIFNETKLKLKISNFIQNEDITSIKPDLVAWLRKQLRNTDIELFTKIEANDQPNKVALTDTDKLNEMIKKNPNLALLKQKFNLDYGE